MKRLITAVLIATTGLIAVAGTASARPDHDGRHHGAHEGAGHMMRMFKGLDLSDDQRLQIDSILDANKADGHALRQRSKALREQMAELDPMAADYSTETQMLANQAAELKREQVLHGGELRRQIAAVLTEEQRTELKTRMEAKRERFRERAERWASKPDA